MIGWSRGLATTGKQMLELIRRHGKKCGNQGKVGEKYKGKRTDLMRRNVGIKGKIPCGKVGEKYIDQSWWETVLNQKKTGDR